MPLFSGSGSHYRHKITLKSTAFYPKGPANEDGSQRADTVYFNANTTYLPGMEGVVNYGTVELELLSFSKEGVKKAVAELIESLQRLKFMDDE